VGTGQFTITKRTQKAAAAPAWKYSLLVGMIEAGRVAFDHNKFTGLGWSILPEKRRKHFYIEKTGTSITGHEIILIDRSLEYGRSANGTFNSLKCHLFHHYSSVADAVV
jgi:hypothetical protein